MRNLFFSLMLTCLTPLSAFACDCLASSFVELFSRKQSGSDVSAVLVKNIGYTNEGVRAQVIEVLRGQVTAKEITITGDRGYLCNGEVNGKEGAVWVAAVYGENDSYSTANCAQTNLKTEKVGNETLVSLAWRDEDAGAQKVTIPQLKKLMAGQYVERPGTLSCNALARSYFDTTDPFELLIQGHADFDESGHASFRVSEDFTLPLKKQKQKQDILVEAIANPENPQAFRLKVRHLGLADSKPIVQIEENYSGGRFETEIDTWDFNLRKMAPEEKILYVSKGVARIERSMPGGPKYFNIPAESLKVNPELSGPQRVGFSVICSTSTKLVLTD